MNRQINSFKILQHKDFERICKKNLSNKLKKVLDRKLEYLSNNLSHPSLNTKQLNISKQTLHKLDIDLIYEFRINMAFRCIIYIRKSTKEIILAYVGNHEQVKAKFN